MKEESEVAGNIEDVFGDLHALSSQALDETEAYLDLYKMDGHISKEGEYLIDKVMTQEGFAWVVSSAFEIARNSKGTSSPFAKLNFNQIASYFLILLEQEDFHFELSDMQDLKGLLEQIRDNELQKYVEIAPSLNALLPEIKPSKKTKKSSAI